jgi:molecular chaperone GrpE
MADEENILTPDTDGESGAGSPAPSGEPDPVAVLQAQRDGAQRLAETFKDQLLRKAAEFENYRRRVEAENAAIMRSANESLLLSLLPVVDDFARSLQAGKDAKDAEALYAGVQLIQTKLLKVLERYGVVPFESAGKPFDVGYHDALLQVPRADMASHMVVQEVERGYMLFDRVLRHAKVIVSASPETPEDGHGEA